MADSSGLSRRLTPHLLLLAQGHDSPRSLLAQVESLQTSRMMVAHISHCSAGKLQAVPPRIIFMVERYVGTGEDGLGKQLALLRRVNLGQRILHLLSLVVIGRLGLDVTGV